MGIQDDLIAFEDEQKQDSRLKLVVNQERPPEQSARVLEMQMQTGLPVDLIERNLDTIEQKARQANFDPEKFRKESPVFAKWASENPHHPAIVADDYEALSGLEWVGRAFKDAHKSGWATVEQGKIGRRMMAGKSTPEDEARLKELREQFPAEQTFGADAWYEKLVTEGAHLLPTMEHALIEGSQKGLLSAVGVGSMAVLAGSAGPQALLPEEVITVPAAAGIGYAVGTAVGAGQAVGDLEAGLAYLEFAEMEGLDGEKIPHEVAYAAASMVGVINAGLETLGLGKIAKHLGGERLVNSFGKNAAKEALKHATFQQAVTRFAVRYAESVGTEVTTEVLQEATNILAGEIAKSVSPGEFKGVSTEEVGNRLAEIAVKTAYGTAVIGGIGPTTRFVADSRAAKRAGQSQAIFEALGDNAKASKLRERSPAKFREYITKLRESGPIEKIRVNIDRFNEYFQSLELDPAQMAAEITGSQEAYSEAVAAGTDLEISLEDYASKVAPTKHHEALLKDLRLRPDEMTSREAETWNANAETILEELAGSLEPTAVDQSVYDDVMGQLLASGMEQDTAERNATLMASVFNTLGQRTGQDAQALYEKYGLRITKPVPDILSNVTDFDTQVDPLIDRLRSGDIPTDRQVFGESLLDRMKNLGGLQDEGGELSARDAKSQVRGLVKNDGMTLDEAAEVAFDYGYIDSHDVNQFMEALDSELAGSPVFTQRDTNEGLQELKGALDSLGQYIDSLGIDLTEADNATVRKALQEPQTFEQAARPQTETTEFKAWFGDSKVVDENGDPMVVYHGSKSPDIKIFEASRAGEVQRSDWGRGIYFTPSQGSAEYYAQEAMSRTADPEGDRLFEEYENKAREMGTRVMYEGIDLGFGSEKYKELQVFSDRWRAHKDKFRKENLGTTYGAYLKVDKPFIYQYVGITEPNLHEQAIAGGHDGIFIVHERDEGEALADTIEEIIVFDSKQIKSADKNVGTFDPNDANIFHQQSRASITINEATRKVAINLSKASDLSSFLHESGHFYLEVLGDLAEAADAPEQIVQDYAAILNWLGVENRQGITVSQHEQFARGFEAYLFEGKAPTPELQNAFSRFRAWLISIYKRLERLNVELSDDVRGVFDRLVATDEAIQAAEESQNYVALFTDAETSGMTPEQFAIYQRRVMDARVDAEEALGQKLLAIKQREQKAWWKEERAKVRESVAEEIHKMRVYQALSYLQKGAAPDGTALDMRHVKLARSELVARYGKDFIKRLPRPYVYQVEGGISSDEVAMLFGYSSGDALIQDIVNARPMKALIEAETDARMTAQFPDPMLDGSLVDEAINAVHNEKREELLAAELRTLRKLARKDRPAVRAAEQATARQRREALQANRGMLPDTDELRLIKIAAVNIVGAKKVRDVDPNGYRVAEAKASRKAFDAAAKGDYQTAYSEKRKQILNHELYRAATDAKVEAEKIREYFKKFDKKRVRERLGKAQDGLLERIEAILQDIDLRKVSLRELDRNRAKREILSQVESGTIVASPDVVSQLEATKAVNWRDISMEQIRGTRDVVRQLETQARAEAEALVNGEKVQIKQAALEVAQSILDGGKRVDVNIGSPRPKEGALRAGTQALLAWLRSSEIARQLDGGQEFGATTQTIIVPIRRAYAEKLIPAEKKIREDVADLYRKHFTNSQLGRLKRETHFQELGFTMSHGDLISLGLNWGNDGNRQAVLNGRFGGQALFNPSSVETALSRLNANEWAFIQDVWDYMDSYWGELSALEKRRRGITPKKVQATPFSVQSADGQRINMRGGYYPLKYRSDLSPNQKGDDIEAMFQQFVQGRYVTANTRAGATHERIGSGGRPVRLGLRVIDEHLHEVVRDISLGDEVRFVMRVLNDDSLRAAMNETGNLEAHQVLKLWLQDSAIGEVAARGFINKASAWTRVGFTKAKLGWSATVTMLQLAGIPQTIAVVGSRAFSHGAGKYAANPVAAHKLVMAESAFMRARYQTNSWNKDVSDTRAYMESYFGGAPTRSKQFWSAVSYTFFLPIAKTQMVVDTMTWLAAYWKGNSLGYEGQALTSYADSVVENAQTSGFFSDRSGIERGTTDAFQQRQSQFVKLWTTLISYMLAKANIAYAKTKNFARKPTLLGAVGLATDLTLLFVVEAVLAGLIRGTWPDNDDDESWQAWLAKESLSSATAGIPFVREIEAARYGGGNTPLGSLTSDIYKVMQQAEQGEVDKALVKSMNNVGGTLFHYPSSQINRAVDAYFREQEGEDVPMYEYVTGDRNR